MTYTTMNLTRLGVIALLGVSTLSTFASVPRKQRLDRYAKLWTKSLFTVPPDVVAPEIVEENPLEDYTLAGVAEIKGGWFVVLINREDRAKRVRIKPGAANEEGFKVVKVEEGSGFMDTKVQVETSGGKQGWVEYDKKFLVLKGATPSAPAANTSGNRGQVTARPGTPNRPPVPTRAASARRTPPRPNASSSRNNNQPSRVRRVPTPPSRNR